MSVKRERDLHAIIVEQERDMRNGDRVHSLSLDAPFGKGETAVNLLTDEGHPLSRSPRRHRGILGHRARLAETRRAYGGRAKHGTLTRYSAGCRCDECRRANTHAAWDYYHAKLSKAARAPAQHNTSSCNERDVDG